MYKEQWLCIIQILSLHIKQTSSVEGFSVNTGNANRQIILSQYADDRNLFLKDDLQIKPTLGIINEFGKHSGLLLNMDKTKGIYLGKKKHQSGCGYNIDIMKNPIKCLGVYVGYDRKKSFELNWDKNISKLEKVLNM